MLLLVVLVDAIFRYNSVKFEANSVVLLLLWPGTSYAHKRWNISRYVLTILSPCLVNLVIFDVTLVLSVFSGKVTTQLRYAAKFLKVCVCERMTKIGVQLITLLQNNLGLAFIECQQFQTHSLTR